MDEFQTLLQQFKIVPVVTPYSVNETLKMTEAMIAGGITCVEITLRTDCAWQAFTALKQSGMPVKVGIGTITNTELLRKAIDVKPDFIVSPGVTEKILALAAQHTVPFLPGVASASELMLACEYGFSTLKLFPAMSVNATSLLPSLAGPFTDVKFCPTGGVNLNNAAQLLAMDNVVCVGGSWMIAKPLLQAEDWPTVTQLSKEAMALGDTISECQEV